MDRVLYGWYWMLLLGQFPWEKHWQKMGELYCLRDQNPDLQGEARDQPEPAAVAGPAQWSAQVCLFHWGTNTPP